jgi:HrpA-like RNA helicase
MDVAGECMSEMPVEPRLARCLLQSVHMNCEVEMAMVASMCSVEFPYVISRGIDITSLTSGGSSHLQGAHEGGDSRSSRMSELKERLLEAMGTFASRQGDHLTLLNIFKGFRAIADQSGNAQTHQSWCDSNCIQYRVLSKADEIYKQLTGLIRKYRHQLLKTDDNSDVANVSSELTSCYEDTESLLRCLLAGYFNNVAQLQSTGQYVTVRGRVEVQMHYTSDYYRCCRCYNHV